MPDYTLGRVPNPPDERDNLFPMRMAVTMADVPLPDYMYWVKTSDVLAQDGIGACVGFAGAHLLRTSPVRRSRYKSSRAIDLVLPGSEGEFKRFTCIDEEDIKADRMGFYLYARCKQKDNYNGEGTWDRVLAQVMVEEGFAQTYLWAFERKELERWLLLKGPVLVGTNWYSGMFTPDPKSGRIKPTGSNEGGHEYMIRGYNRKTGLVRVTNSWGETWGQRGEAWLSMDDLCDLVFNQGGDALTMLDTPPQDLIGRMGA
jgi:hypothetical protein